jgi:uncharacterized protein
MKRIYQTILQEHFASYNKMVFLAGPRQVGKTTIARLVLNSLPDTVHHHYVNWDNVNDQKLILQGPSVLAKKIALDELSVSSHGKPIIIFDEIHKFSKWKNFIKGFFDTYHQQTNIIVTGSAKLDVYRAGGDSLRGRYFLYRVHPLSVAECLRAEPSEKEICAPADITNDDWHALLTFGGFPEPFLERDMRFYNRWARLTYQQLFREEVRDLARIQEIAQLEILAEFLRAQSGQLINYDTLSLKLGVSAPTVKKWVSTLSAFYYCFTLKPWSKNVARSLIKQPKVYLWDWSAVVDEGARIENFVASHLLKAVNFWTDSGFGDYDLHFIRDKQGREVDFLISKDKQPWCLVEVKRSREAAISKNLFVFQQQLKAEHAFQVVFDAPYVEQDCFIHHQPIIVPARTFLGQLV